MENLNARPQEKPRGYILALVGGLSGAGFGSIFACSIYWAVVVYGIGDAAGAGVLIVPALVYGAVCGLAGGAVGGVLVGRWLRMKGAVIGGVIGSILAVPLVAGGLIGLQILIEGL